MSTAQFPTPLIVTIPGQLIASSLWNNEFTNLFNNLNPQGIGAYSDTDVQMQTETDPFPGSTTSRPTAISGEIERLRFTITDIKGTPFWYNPPIHTIQELSDSIDTFFSFFPVTTANIADLAVTTAKIAFGAVTEANISGSALGTGLTGGSGFPISIAAGGVGTTQLASSVAINTLNVVTALSFAGFNTSKILQIVTASTATAAINSGTTFTNTNLVVPVILKIATSQVLVMAFGTFSQPAGSNGYCTLARGATNLFGANGGIAIAANNTVPVTLFIVDTPGANVNYNFQTRTDNAVTCAFPSNTYTPPPTAYMLAIELAV